jgi:hypothetical protein
MPFGNSSVKIEATFGSPVEQARYGWHAVPTFLELPTIVGKSNLHEP